MFRVGASAADYGWRFGLDGGVEGWGGGGGGEEYCDWESVAVWEGAETCGASFWRRSCVNGSGFGGGISRLRPFPGVIAGFFTAFTVYGVPMRILCGEHSETGLFRKRMSLAWISYVGIGVVL